MAFALDTPGRPLSGEEVERLDDYSGWARDAFPRLVPGRAVDDDP